MHGYAVEVLNSTWKGTYIARCEDGHTWELSQSEVMMHMPRDWACRRFICPECLAAFRASVIAPFEDPDRIRIEGLAE